MTVKATLIVVAMVMGSAPVGYPKVLPGTVSC